MSSSAEPARRPGRPRSEAKTAAILDAAVELFLADGYTRTSMDAIAKRAGVSKQTVYGHFADKTALFSAVVEQARAEDASIASLPTEPGEDPATIGNELAAFLDKNLQIALSPKVSALRRLMISEIAHHAELRWFWAEGMPVAARERLAEYLARAAERGVLAVESPDDTAGQMITLSAAEGQLASRYGTAPFSAADRAAIVERTVGLFLRALAR